MNTAEILSIGFRIFFFCLVFWSIHTADVVGLCLSSIVFLIMETLIEELQDD